MRAGIPAEITLNQRNLVRVCRRRCTSPEPPPTAQRSYFFFRFTNIAVTLFAASMVTVHVGSTPLHAPAQPTNADLPEAVAVNVIVVDCVKPKEQLFRQL
jgi:hypothetical protein